MDPLVARLRAAGCVFAEDEAAALREAARTPEELETMAVRRVAGEPLELVIGWAEFDGLRVRVAPGVFVPRLRSTLMVRVAVGLLRQDGPIAAPTPAATLGAERSAADRSALPSVIDLGCGTGAIGAAVAARVPDVTVWAVDVDPAAVDCARRNLPPGRVLLGDLYAPLPAGLRADVVCANAPYVPTGAIALMPPEARDHEHRVALDGGPDGLDVQRRVIAGAPDRLVPGGWLLIESSRAQAPTTATLMAAAGLTPTIHTDDEVDGTVVAGRLDERHGLSAGTRKVVHPPPVDDPRDEGTAHRGTHDAVPGKNMSYGLDRRTSRTGTARPLA